MKSSSTVLLCLAACALAGVPNTFKASDPAKAEQVMANFKYLDSAVGAKLDTSALPKALGAKADTSALNAVKASIPAAVNITGKVDTATLTTRLSGYATTTALTKGLGAKADTTALVARVGAKLDTSALASRLGDYAKTSDLSTYAKTSALASYATTSSLSSYATSSALNGKMNTADYLDASGRIKSVPGFSGGRGMPTQWNGSQILIDTTRVMVNVNTRYADMNLQSITWQNAYSGWALERPDDDTIFLTSHTMTSSAKYLGASSGNVRFYNNVQVDKALTVGTSIKVAGVTMAVPDYVFESDYKLAPLAEVEAFTRENKHLPDVPSAREIKAGGLDLTEMNLTLLRKVEELTLHAIAQEKRIQSLEAELRK